ncbi:hypothetical protein DL93DRAFT_145100 [Clavulina sp. PMI_390]|nr:hypothetical protein DL93DRAFT_145100 [Clavulina sp. PMI_390]
MLNLLWLPDEDLSPDWLVENQETPALGWSPPDQTTALGILSPFINAPFGKETRELNQSGAGPFLDASIRLRALSTQFGPQFNSIPNHVADFADRFHCPSQLPNWCVTSVAICCRVSHKQPDL